MNNIQLQGLLNGFTVVDGGKDSQKINGYRYTVIREADKALYHFATAKQIRELFN